MPLTLSAMRQKAGISAPPTPDDQRSAPRCRYREAAGRLQGVRYSEISDALESDGLPGAWHELGEHLLRRRNATQSRVRRRVVRASADSVRGAANVCSQRHPPAQVPFTWPRRSPTCHTPDDHSPPKSADDGGRTLSYNFISYSPQKQPSRRPAAGPGAGQVACPPGTFVSRAGSGPCRLPGNLRGGAAFRRDALRPAGASLAPSADPPARRREQPECAPRPTIRRAGF